MADSVETKIFDPRDSADGSELLDATVTHRKDRWHMYLAGQVGGHGAPQLLSAHLSPNAPLSPTGWLIASDETGRPALLCGNDRSAAWDGVGGRHCPSYVRGWDPHRQIWVERLYYAGSASAVWGPYSIGYLEWDGASWQDQPAPVFSAEAEWEHGSVFEPNLIYHDGKWKMWYVAGSHQQDFLIHGYAESTDGKTHWSKHIIFATPDLKLFDFCVRERNGFFEAAFSRVWLGSADAPAETGLWWCRADHPYTNLSEWKYFKQIMDARDRGWHRGAWKPSLHFHEIDPHRRIIFFDGQYRTDDPGPFPFAFTLGCLECDVPQTVSKSATT